METKFCNRCNQELPIESFVKDKARKSGYRDYCNACRNKVIKELKIKKLNEEGALAFKNHKSANSLAVLELKDYYIKSRIQAVTGLNREDITQEMIDKKRKEIKTYRRRIKRNWNQKYRYCVDCRIKQLKSEFPKNNRGCVAIRCHDCYERHLKEVRKKQNLKAREYQKERYKARSFEKIQQKREYAKGRYYETLEESREFNRKRGLYERLYLGDLFIKNRLAQDDLKTNEMSDELMEITRAIVLQKRLLEFSKKGLLPPTKINRLTDSNIRYLLVRRHKEASPEQIKRFRLLELIKTQANLLIKHGGYHVTKEEFDKFCPKINGTINEGLYENSEWTP